MNSNQSTIPRFFFDHRDYELLKIVNEFPKKEQTFQQVQARYYPYFHPHGIKELAESKGLRIAYAVIYLLNSLEVGKAQDRLIALRTLWNEVQFTAEGSMPKNTARVLLEIMKELVRSQGNPRRQLELAHDFRVAAFGKPRVIRRLLKRYHLLEMPEAWNQIAFDDHVHDVNTKGRKSATHLIMDAWIKGIRRLRVIYYNHITPRFASELMEAAGIMDIDLRIGIEFPALYRDKYIRFIWVPRGFRDAAAFMKFLSEPAVVDLMKEGCQVSQFTTRHVLETLKAFNQVHRVHINSRFGIDLPPLDEKQFLDFVGTGQASLLHLGKFIHLHLLPIMRQRVDQFRQSALSAEDKSRINHLVMEMDLLDSETIVDRYLRPERNPDIPDPNDPQASLDVPPLLKTSPRDLIFRLAQLHTEFRITLNLSNLKVEDVVELLYDCNGAITRLEIFNLKDFAAGKTDHIPEIIQLQQAINKSNVIALMRILRDIIEKVAGSRMPDKADRMEKLIAILHDIGTFKNMYDGVFLKSRIGSDSTGHSPKVHGMGLAIRETLPGPVQWQLHRRSGSVRQILPIRMTACYRATWYPYTGKNPLLSLWDRFCRAFPFAIPTIGKRVMDWQVEADSTQTDPHGNIVTLGGVEPAAGNGLSLTPPATKDKSTIPLKYLNSRIKNSLKILVGFAPAFATFFFTNDWWVLAWLGGFIWFGITGLRNVVQSVFGGGGLRRSPLLSWNDYLSWERLSDSLLFTGFSVPLLDWIIKTLVLNNTFGINMTTSPFELYAFMSLANGVYISSHNIFRGLPKGAIVGNLFRSVLAIPVAMGFNMVAGWLLMGAGVAHVDQILQKWAAIISKLASDCIAGVIEGLADRFYYLTLRYRDYENKLIQLFDLYARLEMMFPETPAMERICDEEGTDLNICDQARQLETIMIINALDLLYFWMYQPRARHSIRKILKSFSDEEREIFIRSQFILRRHRQISQLFIDGIVGRNFMKALAFYLDRSEEYLKDLMKMQS